MPDRDYKQYPQNIAVETNFGTIFLSITEAKHIYADASGSGKFLTFRDEHYACSLHVSSYDGGKTWEPSRETREIPGKKGEYESLPHESRSSFYCSRRNSLKEAPPSYAKALKEEMLRAVREFIALPTSRNLLSKAEYANLYNQQSDVLKEINEYEAKLAAAKDKFYVLNNKIRDC